MVGLENDNHSHLELVGSSCKASVLAGKTQLTYIGFEPGEKPSAVVAVIIHVTHSEKGREKSISREGHLFKIDQKEDKVHLDTEEVWVPMKGRLGQFVGEYLQVCVGDEFYGTDRTQAEKDSSYHFVQDGSRLCRYLNDEADVEALKAAVEKVKMEESSSEKAGQEKAEFRRLLREQTDLLRRVKSIAEIRMNAFWTSQGGYKEIHDLLSHLQ